MSTIFQALERSEVTRPALTTATSTSAAPPPPGRHDEYERLKIMLTVETKSRLRRVMVVSTAPREGVSTVTLGLGAAVAEAAQHGVLLVESHPGAPALGARLGTAAALGISEVITKDAPPERAIVATSVPRLSLMTRGRVPIDLSQPRWLGLFDELMADLQSGFDLCLFDGGALEAQPESLLLASHVDGVLLVVEAERTPMSRVEAAAEMLARAGANVLGVVLNRRRGYIPKFLERRLAA